MEEDLSMMIDHAIFSEVIEVVSPEIITKVNGKREAKPETWRRNVMKRLRAEGKEYVNSKGRVKSRVQGPDCKCRFKCFEKIPERQELLNRFNALADKQKQQTRSHARSLYLQLSKSAEDLHRRRPHGGKSGRSHYRALLGN
jgi:hypothetical protein